jgi:fructose-1,6-bisphosphatase I/sedoheptulose-1,7-bisphosphatase
MPLSNRRTLTQYLIEQRQRFPQATGALNALILDVALAAKAIARAVAFGELGDPMSRQLAAAAREHAQVNVQGEVQKPLDIVSNEVFIRTTEWSGHLAGMASEEMAAPYPIPETYQRGKYLLVFDPLDGSSNIDVNVSVGSIFSIRLAPRGVRSRLPAARHHPDRRRLRDLRAGDDARADGRQWRRRVHARPEPRRVQADAS